jgi:hypothetical protein
MCLKLPILCTGYFFRFSAQLKVPVVLYFFAHWSASSTTKTKNMLWSLNLHFLFSRKLPYCVWNELIRSNQWLWFSTIIDKYLRRKYYSMKGTCEVCGTKEIEVLQRNINGQLKSVCENCAWTILYLPSFYLLVFLPIREKITAWYMNREDCISTPC